MENKQIQISTVRQMSDVEVIFVNASIISKAIRSSIAAHNALDKCVCFEPFYEFDENGEPKRKPNGECVIKGDAITSYNTDKIGEDDLKSLYETVVPFLDELCKAFEE